MVGEDRHVWHGLHLEGELDRRHVRLPGLGADPQTRLQQHQEVPEFEAEVHDGDADDENPITSSAPVVGSHNADDDAEDGADGDADEERHL